MTVQYDPAAISFSGDQAFAIEGLKNLQLALRLAKSLRSVFISQKSLLRFPQSVLHDLARRNTPAYSASPSIIAKILATRYEPDSDSVSVIQMEQWNLERLTSRNPQFVLFCDHVVDPRNLGVIIRTADAASAAADAIPVALPQKKGHFDLVNEAEVPSNHFNSRLQWDVWAFL